MSTDRMEHYLARMSQEGVHDSEGDFTVSGEVAVRKLAFNQLPRTSAWILKVIQAGVAARSERIALRQLGRSVQVCLEGAGLGTLEQVVEAWTTLSSSITEAQAELAVALRAVCFAGCRPCILVHNDRKQGYRVVMWDGVKLSRILGATDLLQRRVPLSWVKVGGWAICVLNSRDKEVRAEEFDEVTRYAVTCPVPLDVDGRELNHFGIKDVSRTRRSVMFSAQTVKSGDLPTRRGIRLPPNLGEGKEVRLAWVLYSDEEPGTSRLCWVRGGVVVEEQNLALGHKGLYFRIFLPAEGLPTDLTTLAPRFPDPQAKQKWGRLALSQLKEDLRTDRDLARRTAVELAKDTKANWQTIAFAFLGGICAMPFTKGLSLVATTAYLVHEIRGEDERAHREGTEKVEALFVALDRFDFAG